MPRTSRTNTEFTVNGKTWLARFVHNHNESGLLHHIDGRMIRGRHLTTCKLAHKGSSAYLIGQSLCSMKETYRWQFGIKQALIRAMAKASITPEADRKLYGLMLQTFFQEMQIKNYWPHNHVDSSAAPTLPRLFVDGKQIKLLTAPLPSDIRPIHGLGAVR